MFNLASLSGSNGGSPRGAGYPAAPQPHGLLLADRGFSKKAAARWAAVEQHLSVASIGLGLLVFLLSWRYLFHFTEATGKILGALLVVSGWVGWFGGRRRSANIVNLQLIASVVGVLLAFNVISEVVRDTQVDCALAELYHRGKATEASVGAVQQVEALQSVFMRLNEIEDSMTMVQQGAAKHMELRQEQQNLKLTDLNYIRSKVDMVKRHAEELLDSVLKNPNITTATITKLSEEEKASLRRRLDTADRVLERIQKHHASKDEEITFAEYQEILAALTDAGAMPEDKAHSPELQQAKRELSNMKAAIERSQSDLYHTLQLGDAPAHLAQLEAYRQQRRQQFNEQFKQQLEKQQQRSGSAGDYLVDLPEHCVKETTGEKVMVMVGIASILLQLATAYVDLSLSFRLPVKGE